MQYELSFQGVNTQIVEDDIGEIQLEKGRVFFLRDRKPLVISLKEDRTKVLRGFVLQCTNSSEPMSPEQVDAIRAVIGAFVCCSTKVVYADDTVIRFQFKKGIGIGKPFTANDEIQISEARDPFTRRCMTRMSLIRGVPRASSVESIGQWDLYPISEEEMGFWIDLIATLVQRDLVCLSEQGCRYGVRVRGKEKADLHVVRRSA